MTLQVDYSQWEKGRDYPEWMNEVSIATISKKIPKEIKNKRGT